MQTYDLTLVGFDIGDADTDHLVWWVKAPSREALDAYLAKNPCPLAEPPTYLEGRAQEILPEECDMLLDAEGNVVWVSDCRLIEIAAAEVGQVVEVHEAVYNLDGNEIGFYPTGCVYTVAPACNIVGARTCYDHQGSLVSVPPQTMVRVLDDQEELNISYQCPECGHAWDERWSCACDSECPECGTGNIAALDWKPIE